MLSACLLMILGVGLFTALVYATFHPGERCARTEVQLVATYPYMAFLSTNPSLAMIPVFVKEPVCVEWVPIEDNE